MFIIYDRFAADCWVCFYSCPLSSLCNSPMYGCSIAHLTDLLNVVLSFLHPRRSMSEKYVARFDLLLLENIILDKLLVDI